MSYIDFQNIGSSTCELRGTPGVNLVGHGNGTQLGRAADRGESGTPPTVHIRPGESARTSLSFEYVDQSGGVFGPSCHTAKADGYRIYPPHSYNAVFVRSIQYGCTNTKIHWGGTGYLDKQTIGCATTRAQIPAGATTRKITDVDGDYRADTEWITPTRVGITTASGATSSVKPNIAGGAAPRAFSVKLRNTSKAITLIAGSRDVQVFRFTGCRLQPVINAQGHQYRFDLTGTHGNGVSCTDPDHNGADQLTGLLLGKSLGSLHDGDQDTITATDIGINGLHGVNGRARTSTATWPQDQKQLQAAATIACRGATIDRDGITAHQ